MAKPKVVVWRPMYDQIGHELFSEAGAEVVVVDSTQPADVMAELHDARAIWVRTPERISAEMMDAAPELVVISTSGFGTDNVDIAAATERGILVVNNLGFGRKPVSEHTIMLMLALMNRLIWADRATRDGSAWSQRSNIDFLELEGRTVGLVGLGYIGSELCRKLVAGFRCTVLAYDPHVDRRLPPAVGAQMVGSLDDLLPRSSILCLCAELNDATRNMISARELALLPEGAIVINTARGALLDIDALAEALEAGHVFGAGLDTTFPEPLPLSHPIHTHANVILTPHVAGLTAETATAQTRFSVSQVMDVLKGGEPAFPVNPEAWQGPASRRPGAKPD